MDKLGTLIVPVNLYELGHFRTVTDLYNIYLVPYIFFIIYTQGY